MLREFSAKIQGFISRGECVQIIALPGFGKSRFGRSLGGLFLDPNLLQTPEDLLSTLKSSAEARLIVFDSIDHVLHESYQSVYKYLKALRDNNKGHLALVFLVSKSLPPSLQPLLADLYELITEHIEYLPTLEPSEYDLFGFLPTPKQLKDITQLSGGIPALVKICVLAMRDGLSLDPASNPKLKAQLEEMLAVSIVHPAYDKSELIWDYLAGRKSLELTASETRLLSLLEENKNLVISKDRICEAIYPDVKNRNGISDHALDQLVHRLRAKIKDKYTLSTRRGLGYRLT